MPNVCPTCGRELPGQERRRRLPDWFTRVRPRLLWLLREFRQAWRDSAPPPAEEPDPPVHEEAPRVTYIYCGKPYPYDPRAR
jgi:hypothetical protein